MGMVTPLSSEAGGVAPHKRQEQPLLAGDTAEVDAVCLALEQCLFHRIRVKDFGKWGVPTPNSLSTLAGRFHVFGPCGIVQNSSF